MLYLEGEKMLGGSVNLGELEKLYKMNLISKEDFEKIKERYVALRANEGGDLLYNDLIESFTISISDRILKPTVAAYKRRVTDFAKHFNKLQESDSLDDVVFEPFNLYDIENYFDYLAEHNESVSFMNNTKSAINSFSEYLSSIGIDSPDIRMVKIDNTKYRKRLRFAYTKDEVYNIADSGDLRQNVIVRLCFEGGLKRNQLINIKSNDFNFNTNQLFIYDEDTGILDRAFTLTDKTVDLVKEYLNELYENIEKWNNSRIVRGREPREDYGYIFQNIKVAKPGYPVINTALKKAAEKYYKKLGITGEELEEKISDFTTESIKSSLRVYLFSKGLSTNEVMSLLGEKNYAFCNKSKKLVQVLYPNEKVSELLKTK